MSEIYNLIFCYHFFSAEPDTKRNQENLLEKFIKKRESTSQKDVVNESPEAQEVLQQTSIESIEESNTANTTGNNSSEQQEVVVDVSENEEMDASDLAETLKKPLTGKLLQEELESEEAEEEDSNTANTSDNNLTDEQEVIMIDDNCEDKKTVTHDPSTSTTPKKPLSAKQLQKKLESEKKRMEKQKEREEKEKERQRLKEEKEKLKQEKEELKLKEKLERQKERELKEEQKRKEKEEKEQKKKEKEEKEEQKRKEKEQEKLKRQMEIDEKNKEKEKAEQKKQKAAAAFVNFFTKKVLTNVDDKKETNPSIFMPFEVKSDMRLAPLHRNSITQEEKDNLIQALLNQNPAQSYLKDIKNGKTLGKSENTWPYEDQDVVIVDVETNLGESIMEQKPETLKTRAKYLYFHENQRPPYFGTWRKKSKLIKPRKPLAQDDIMNYEVDSDDEWEEEDPGESLRGSDDEDKENDSGNEYEVDNEFFVPHGHLSEDELDDEENAAFSPEAQKVKLKLLKNEFDEEMKAKTQKIKPRLIGCIWYDKNHTIEDEAIDHYLKPFTILHNNDIVIKKRTEVEIKSRNSNVQLDKEYIRDFIKLIDNSTKKRKEIVEEFHANLKEKEVIVPKTFLVKLFKSMAQWKKTEKNNKKGAFSWIIGDEFKIEYAI